MPGGMSRSQRRSWFRVLSLHGYALVRKATPAEEPALRVRGLGAHCGGARVTTEDDFHKALDANPEDWQTRLVFADWLQDRGDPRAEGYRALGALQKRPYHIMSSWWQDEGLELFAEVPYCNLSRDWYGVVFGDWLLARGRTGQREREPGVQYDTRREAEDAAAIAFAKLPASRRAELLAGPVGA